MNLNLKALRGSYSIKCRRFRERQVWTTRFQVWLRFFYNRDGRKLANSAIYQGTVVAQNLLDLNPLYPTWAGNTTLTLDMTNVLGTDLQRFPGTPEIGRVTMLRLVQKF